MALEMKSVYSSWIAEIGYDPDTQRLVYVTEKGATVVHEGVSLEDAEKVGAIGQRTPPSIGEALHAHIRGKYGHVKGVGK